MRSIIRLQHAHNQHNLHTQHLHTRQPQHTPQLYIYALKLVQDKYYIGSTIDPLVRLDQHIAAAHPTSTASAWTAKYPVIDIVELFEGDRYDEDLITKKYMYEYGIDNVRGASYTQIVLDAGSRTSLIRELRAANGTCMRCGRRGHFIAACYAATSGDSYPLSPLIPLKPHATTPTHTQTPITATTTTPPRQFHMVDDSLDEPADTLPQIPPLNGIVADAGELIDATNLLAVKIIEWFN
jgi:predicted GIY-YIG superfamily endonuclease